MVASSRLHSEQIYVPHPFLSSVEEIYTRLKTNSDTGLSPLQVQEAQVKYGANKLDGEGRTQWYSVLIKQISNAMILVSLHSITYAARPEFP